MQVFSGGPLLTDIRSTGAIHVPAADASISYIDARDIADPSMQDEDVFRRCRDEITRCLARGLERLLAA